MDTREAVIAEIRTAPDSVVEEVYEFVRFLKSKPGGNIISSPASPRALPDFLARQKELFGNRMLPDSQELFDELRADRF